MLSLLTLLLTGYSGTMSPIPIAPPSQYVKEGIFHGGDRVASIIANVRMANHGTFERWVFDFSHPKKLDSVTPEMSVQLIPEGIEPAKVHIFLRPIAKNRVSLKHISDVVSKSQWIDSIKVYPILENLECAIELVAKPGTPLFLKPHQPPGSSAKLVLDLTTQNQ